MSLSSCTPRRPHGPPHTRQRLHGIRPWPQVGASAVVLAVLLGFLPRSIADEKHIEFVRKLQEQGLVDISLEYLRGLKLRDDIPEEIKADLGYEIGRALVMLADEMDPETARGTLGESEQTLVKFLEEHGDSGLADAALGELAGVRLQQGQRTLARAEGEKDAAKRTQLRQAARRHFDTARQDFTTAIARYRQELGNSTTAQSSPDRNQSEPSKNIAKTKTGAIAKVPAVKKPRPKSKQGVAPKSDGKDPRLEADLILARINLATCDFFTSLTLDASVETEKALRAQRLESAIQEFDSLFQEYRGAFAGFVAHLWHGRTVEELGDLRQAIMIYDEVIVNEPPKGAQVPKDQAALFVQAELFRLRAMNKQGKHGDVVPEATQWLNGNQDKRRTPHGLGIQLELAKANIASGLAMPGGSAERRAVFARALQTLNNEVVKFRSPYVDEAFRLRAQHAHEVSAAGGKIASFDEGQFVGDTALAKDPPQFEEAIHAYEQALALANDKTDPEERDATVYRLSYALLRADNTAKALSTAEQLARSNPRSKWAPDCAALAIAACSSSYTTAAGEAERQAALSRLQNIASFLEEHWPRHSQADTARRTVGTILMYRREFLRAAEVLQRINQGSTLHAEGQTKAAQAYWNAFLTELSKPASERDEEGMRQWVEQARFALQVSLASQGAEGPDGTRTPLRAETQLLLVEIALRQGNHNEASTLLEPLLAALKSGGAKDLASLADRILIAALESVIAQGELTRAEAIMGDLEQQGAGTARVTQVLVGLGRGLEQQLRQHEAAGRTSEAESVRKSFESFLGKLAARQQQSFGTLQYLAESYFAMGNYEKAGDTFDRMLQLAEQDPAVGESKEMRGEIVRVRLRRATALRLTSKFELALEELDVLLKENDRLLPAIMEKGRVLQDWGEQNPPRLLDAAKHWDQTSKRLQTSSPRPAEYFEARYGLALSLSRLGKKQDAIKVLRSTMALSANVGGPELRTKYESLLRELDAT